LLNWPHLGEEFEEKKKNPLHTITNPIEKSSNFSKRQIGHNLAIRRLKKIQFFNHFEGKTISQLAS
jgi:hypothetical protein